jgi:serine/threonine protein kinase
MRWLSNSTVTHLRRVAEWPDLADTKYRLLEELGRGGMGTVYLAEDAMLGRRVALKVVGTGVAAPQAAERLLREAGIIARLEHPGIVPVHDAGALPDGRVFYAMKRVDGRRLDELAAGAALPERLRIFQRICEAVAFAHAHGVIHRDLKPENVMVGPFGEVLVMDWGVAKLLAPESGEAPPPSSPSPGTAATAEGTVVGTLAWMAPEQAEGAGKDVGPLSDVYALGAILHFLLTGQPPFDDEAARRRVGADSRLPPVPPRRIDASIPRSLEAIAKKAMAVAPGERYPTAEALSAEISRFLDGERVLAHAEGPLERAQRIFARYRAPIFLVLAYLTARILLILFAHR